MTQINDGGPAFPQHKFIPSHGGGGYWTQVGGMTLRDWFAGQALAFLADPASTGEPDYTAQYAYKLADAMITARGASHE